MRTLHPLLMAIALSAVCDAAAADRTAETPGDKPIALSLKPERATTAYRVQGDQPIEHPMGDGLSLAGQRFAIRTTDKGMLEIDLAGDGKFAAVRAGPLTVALGQSGDKRRAKIDLFVTRGSNGAWSYRTITRLRGQLGDTQVAIVDVDGDGVFNEPGVDAMAIGEGEYAFPLPDAGERWCTATLDVTGLAFGPMGEQPTLVGKPLTTTIPEAMPVLTGINEERLKAGLTPRPENTVLSAPLQKHIAYMVGTGTLAHPEQAGSPNYSADGHDAGMNSILSMGNPAPGVAAGMVATFYHRQDVVRPDTRGFGVGYGGRFGGIDGRRALAGQPRWPVIIPVPDQSAVPTRFAHESPDPIGGDREAGFPITAYFGTDALTMNTWKLELLDKSGPKSIDCYVFDGKVGGDVSFNRYQRVAGLIAKDPLQSASLYRVSMTVDVAGTPWTKTWQFSTDGYKTK
ncbi:MAG: hypothetical protein H0V44_16545 [Planctomycetes bacterium]|nr:hypothetical protein [Planctomycetota bacterium]